MEIQSIHNAVVHGGEWLETLVNKLLKEGHAESPNGFVIKSLINIFKAGNQFTGYVSDFTHNQKIKKK